MTTAIIERRIERDKAHLATTKSLLRIAEIYGESYLAGLYAVDISHAEERLTLHRAELARQQKGAGQ